MCEKCYESISRHDNMSHDSLTLWHYVIIIYTINCGNVISISNCRNLIWILNSLFNIVYYLLVTFILSNMYIDLFVKCEIHYIQCLYKNSKYIVKNV